jgi:hypothetical protein
MKENIVTRSSQQNTFKRAPSKWMQHYFFQPMIFLMWRYENERDKQQQIARRTGSSKYRSKLQWETAMKLCTVTWIWLSGLLLYPLLPLLVQTKKVPSVMLECNSHQTKVTSLRGRHSFEKLETICHTTWRKDIKWNHIAVAYNSVYHFLS